MDEEMNFEYYLKKLQREKNKQKGLIFWGQISMK